MDIEAYAVTAKPDASAIGFGPTRVRADLFGVIGQSVPNTKF